MNQQLTPARPKALREGGIINFRSVFEIGIWDLHPDECHRRTIDLPCTTFNNQLQQSTLKYYLYYEYGLNK